MIGLGLWLVLRNFERIAVPSLERLIGLLLLYANLLAGLHFALLPADRAQAFAMASEGLGGGFVGASIYASLHRALGVGGTAIALAAWLLIGLVLSLDVAVLDLFRWAPPLYEHLAGCTDQDAWAAWQSRRTEQAGGPEALAGYSPRRY